LTNQPEYIIRINDILYDMRQPIAVYPGSFDPPTNGHLDIISRASCIFSKVIVAVSDNSTKNPSFSIGDRFKMLKEATKNMPGVETDTFSGLLVNYVRRKKASVIIRGLRAVSDFEYEFQMALMNRRLNRKIETVFLMPDESYTYISSSLIKQVARLGGTMDGLVPHSVERFLKEKR